METIRIDDLEDPIPTPAASKIINDLEGVDINFDRSALMEMARTQLDVPLSIDDSFLDRFLTPYDEVKANGSVHKLGLLTMQQSAVMGMVDTSRMQYMFERFPEIPAQPIKEPLIVAGMPRSGTTYLLQLISKEPSLISLKKWESICPFPSKAILDGAATDTRREEAREKFDAFHSILPLARTLFNVDLDDSTEELEVMVKGGYGITASFLGDTPQFDNQFYNTSQVEAYTYLYRQLQALQWLKKADTDKRWLLKTPQHLGALDALDTVFPDSTVVFTHRDPASVFTSLMTLLGYGVRQCYSNTTKQQIIERTRRMQHGFLRGIVKQADRFKDRCVHVYFNELMADYQDVVANIFKAAGMPFDDEAKARVDRQANLFKRGGQGGRVVYDLEGEFGITRDQVREEFSYYFDKFPVAIEEQHQ